MAEDFALAFRRYWFIIATVATALIYAGSVYIGTRDEIAQLRADLLVYVTEREGLLRDINGRFDRLERRMDRIEVNR